MNTETLKGSWEEQKNKLKQRFANLTDNDLHYELGKGNELFEKIQMKLGKTSSEMTMILSGL